MTASDRCCDSERWVDKTSCTILWAALTEEAVASMARKDASMVTAIVWDLCSKITHHRPQSFPIRIRDVGVAVKTPALR